LEHSGLDCTARLEKWSNQLSPEDIARLEYKLMSFCNEFSPLNKINHVIGIVAELSACVKTKAETPAVIAFIIAKSQVRNLLPNLELI
jgi:hypothetical protein